MKQSRGYSIALNKYYNGTDQFLLQRSGALKLKHGCSSASAYVLSLSPPHTQPHRYPQSTPDEACPQNSSSDLAARTQRESSRPLSLPVRQSRRPEGPAPRTQAPHMSRAVPSRWSRGITKSPCTWGFNLLPCLPHLLQLNSRYHPSLSSSWPHANVFAWDIRYRMTFPGSSWWPSTFEVLLPGLSYNTYTLYLFQSSIQLYPAPHTCISEN